MSGMIRSVVVAGAGSVAWITAAGLKRAFRANALDVCVVDGGPEDSPVGWWTLPSQRGIHALLGINEAHFLRQTGSTFKLATEHRNWQGDGSAFVHLMRSKRVWHQRTSSSRANTLIVGGTDEAGQVPA